MNMTRLRNLSLTLVLLLVSAPVARTAEPPLAPGEAAVREAPLNTTNFSIERSAAPATAGANTGWEEVGTGSATGGGISGNDGASYGPSAAIDFSDDHPCVAWIDDSSGLDGEIWVRRWSGSGWNDVGGQAPIYDGHYSLSLAIAPDDTSYVAADVDSGADSAVELWQWDRSDWNRIPVGWCNGDSSSPSMDIDLNGGVYVAWVCSPYVDPYGQNIYVLKWNGSSWSEMGGSASGGGVSGTYDPSTDPTVAVASDDTPYVAWQQVISPTAASEIYVRSWNGSSWLEMGGSASGGGVSNNGGYSDDPSIAIGPDNRPYVAWRNEWGANDAIHVRRWNGSSWEELGAGSATGGGISGDDGLPGAPSMAVALDGTPFVAWAGFYYQLQVDSEIYVKRWNGSSWEEVGTDPVSGGGISDNSGQSANPSLVIDSAGTPYVAWEDTSGGDREIYLRRWPGDPDTTLPSITNTRVTADPINRLGCGPPETVAIRADVTDDAGVDWVRLYYQPPGSSGTLSSTMSLETGDTYTTTIGPFANAGTVNYYVRARDNNGNEGQSSANSVMVNDCSTTSVYLPMVVRRHISPPYAPLCGPANNHCEEYNERQSAYGPLQLNVLYQAYPEDDHDFYYFSLSSPRRVTVRVTNYQADGQLRVYNGWPDTDRYRDYEPRGGVRDGVLEVRDLDLTAGTYYIRVYTDPRFFKDDALYTLTVID